MRVVIAGGGTVGTFIGSELVQAGHEVTIVEVDPDRVRQKLAAGDPPGAHWLAADACEVSEFARADDNQADVVAAVTGDDEDNLVISLLAKQEFGVPRVIARVNHPKNEWLFNETWGVDVSVSTPHLLTALVEEAVSVGSLVRLLQFEGGTARLEEVTLADSSPAVGKLVSELGMPRDSTLVAIVRDEHVIVPRGDTALQAADEVLVLLTPDSESGVHEIFVSAS